MKIRLLNNDSINEPLKESPRLEGLYNQEVNPISEWVRRFVNAENWQAAQLKIDQLQALIENVREKPPTEENEFIKWEINEQFFNVDLSLLIGNLAIDILLTETGSRTDSLILE